MQLLPGKSALPALFVLLLLASCKKDDTCDNCPPGNAAQNRPPVARAGIDYAVVLPTDSATLDGRASSDPDGPIARYQWAKVRGSSAYHMSVTDSAFVTVTSLAEGVYEFELTVSDAQGASSKDTVQLTVLGTTSAVTCDGSRQRVAATLVPAGTLSIPRILMAVAAAGNKIVFAGGYSGDWDRYQEYARVDILDVTTNTWSVHEMSRIRSNALTAVLGTKIYIAGGYSSDWAPNTVDVYDAVTDNWTVLVLPDREQRRSMIVAAAAGNKVLFVSEAGELDSPPHRVYTIVEIFDAVARTWQTDTLHRRTSSSWGDMGIAATVIGSQIYLAGNASSWYGFEKGSVTTTIDIYDAATGAWSASELKQPRGFMAAVAVGNRNFWAGGVSGKNASWTNMVEIRDVVTGTSTFSCLSNENAHFSAVATDNKVVFFTSFFGPESRYPTSLEHPQDVIPKYPRTTFDIYDLTTNTWSIGVLPKEITNASIVSLNNTIYVTEGYEDRMRSKASNKLWKLEF